MKLKSYFFASLFAISIMFAACDTGTTNREDQGRTDDMQQEEQFGTQDQNQNQDNMGTQNDTTDTTGQNTF